MIFPKYILFFLVLLFPSVSVPMTAYEIMKKVDQRYTGETIEQTSTLVLIDKKNRKRERKLKGFTKEVSTGTKSISFFLSPSDVKNTSYLSYNWDDPSKDNDSWLYLPSLQKTNRISGGDRSNSFMGSDFTYADLDGVEIEDYTFKIVKDLVVDRGSFDKIIQAGGYVSINTGNGPDANSILIGKEDAEEAFDSAACIGCGACVASCPNASAALFTSAKISHLLQLPQGQIEQKARVKSMVDKMDEEGFGACSNHAECEAVCPKGISIKNIANMRRSLIKSIVK